MRQRSGRCRTRCLLSEWMGVYFVAEEDELAEDGEGLEVLGEGPGVVAYEGAVEGGVEEECEYCCEYDEVVGLEGVEVLVVAGAEEDDDAVEDVCGEEGGDELLYFEDGVAGGVVGEVALGGGGGTL